MMRLYIIVMGRGNYILIGSDDSMALATIIKCIAGLGDFNCITSAKTSDTIQLIRSLRPSLIILYFKEVQGLLNSLQSFTEIKDLNLLCLTHKFQNKELAFRSETALFVQSFEDALNNNNLRKNVAFLLRSIENTKPTNHYNPKSRISNSYKTYNNNLARYTLELDQKRAMLNMVKQKIKQFCIEADISTKSKLMTLLNSIKMASDDKGHWEDFKMYFEEINPQFVRMLSKRFPKLTSKDIKYCCYLKMNMSNEDIRNILGINQESVRTHKYRLKRKMTLTKEQNLRHFLHAFPNP